VIALGGSAGEVMAVGSVLISIEVEGAGNLKVHASTGCCERGTCCGES
jgi:2-oxoisovalerate dehydrogenase E2 component (dihydrolipoyl transacylase)